jgi:hypothetical protein
VAAHYGIGYNRGGKKIWAWVSDDGGRVWTGAEIPLPRVEAVLAADAVTGFDPDGSALLTFLFADSAFRGGAAITRTGRTDLSFRPAEIVVPDRLALGGGAVDKGWLAVDRATTSPFFGTTYLSWHYNRPLPDRTVESSLWVRANRAGQWSDPVRVAPHFGGQIAVRSDGTLEAIFVGNDERTLIHTSSSDGGRSFAAPDTIVSLADSTTIDVPTVTVIGGDTTVVCWTAGSAGQSIGYKANCTTRGGESAWSAPIDPDPTMRTTAAFGYPAITANSSGLWLLGYRADSAATKVNLYRSQDGGRSFELHATLATRPFGIASFCPAAGAPCRRAPADSGIFFPGDYFGLSPGPDRVVAAFTLPEGDEPSGRSTVFVSIVRIPRA